MVIILDGNNLAAAANSVARLSTKDSFPTQAIHGFLGTLKNLMNEFHPESVFIAWDGGRSRERLALLPDYKGARKAGKEKTPEQKMLWEEFYMQIPAIQEVAGYLGCIQASGKFVEADDLIALFVKAAKAKGKETVIASNDKDFIQLVEPGVSLYRTSANKKHITSDNVVAIHGLRPDQWLEFRALWGDTSDEIPGVPGIGEKTAMKILQDHGDLAAYAAYLHNKPKKLGKREQAVLDNLHAIARNKQLMDLVNIIPTDMSTVQLTPGQQDWKCIRALFMKYEFKTYLLDLSQWQRVFHPLAPKSEV